MYQTQLQHKQLAHRQATSPKQQLTKQSHTHCTNQYQQHRQQTRGAKQLTHTTQPDITVQETKLTTTSKTFKTTHLIAKTEWD